MLFNLYLVASIINMKSDILKEFTSLKAVLEKERESLQLRLNAINAVLSGQSVDAEAALATLGGKKKRGRPKGSKNVVKEVVVKKRGRRKMSEAAKQRIAAAARERWAKVRAQKAAATAAATQPATGEQQAATPPPQA